MTEEASAPTVKSSNTLLKPSRHLGAMRVPGPLHVWTDGKEVHECPGRPGDGIFLKRADPVTREPGGENKLLAPWVAKITAAEPPGTSCNGKG